MAALRFLISLDAINDSESKVEKYHPIGYFFHKLCKLAPQIGYNCCFYIIFVLWASIPFYRALIHASTMSRSGDMFRRLIFAHRHFGARKGHFGSYFSLAPCGIRSGMKNRSSMPTGTFLTRRLQWVSI